MRKTTPTTLATLEIADGSYTKTWRESANFLLEELIPKNNEEDETGEQQNVRRNINNILEEIRMVGDIETKDLTVSNYELELAIKILKKKTRKLRVPME